MNQERYGLPPQLFTARPDSRDAESRIAVDVGSTGLFERRGYRISYEFSSDQSPANQIANGTSRWIRFTSAVDFILNKQDISIDDGVIRLRVFRDGIDQGGFSTPISTWSTNTAENVPAYASQVSIATGGTVDTTGEEASETIRVRTADGTGQRTTIGGTVFDERYVKAGTYFIQLENIGTGATQGVFDLAWEERPADLNDWLVRL